jgi:menaquinone-dependent protoporphyrinogen oxidase
MESVVLVTYATRTGSTEEVARTIGEILREHGLTVEIHPAAEVRTLAPYSAVVLGAPLYMGRLLKDARKFLSTHRAALMKTPTALFVLGPVQAAEKDWTGARQQLDKQLANFSWFAPVAQQIVGGKFDPAKLGFPFSLILKKVPAGDVRDWTAIRTFASDLALLFQPVPQ